MLTLFEWYVEQGLQHCRASVCPSIPPIILPPPADVDHTDTTTTPHYFTARCYAYAVLAMGLCPCLSQLGVLSKRMNESSWFLACELPSYTVLKGNSVISINKGTSLWNFVLNSGLRKFPRHIDRRNVL